MYVFSSEPKSADFESLASYLASAEESSMHSSLWLKREKMIARLQVVVTRAFVEEADRAIYHAMRLLVYK